MRIIATRIFFIFYFLQCCAAIAQYTLPENFWQHAYGGSSDDQFRSILVTEDGGFIAAGYTQSDDGDVSIKQGISDVWVVKADSVGTIEWERTYGGSSTDWGRNIGKTSDGGYIVTAYSKSNDGDVTVNYGDFDYWIFKLNSSGDILWQKSFGGSAFDNAYQTIETSDGNFIVIGFTESNDSDVVGSHGLQEYFILKLDSAGNKIWAKTLGGSHNEQAASVVETDDHAYLVAGYSDSNDGDIHGNKGNKDFWVVKLSTNGDTLWTKTYGGTKNDAGRWIEKTTGGSFVVAGYAASNNMDVSNNHGDQDYWVVKIDSTGAIQWQKTFGGSLDEYPYFIERCSSGNYVACGLANSNDGDVTNQYGKGDFWVVMMDSTGNFLWQKSYGGSRYDEARGISQTNDENLLIAGFAASSDSDVTASHGGYDAWIVRTCTPPPAIILNDSIITACKGALVTLSANAGTGYSYQWKRNDTTLNGATSSSYVSKIKFTASYTVVVTSAKCSAASAPVTITRLKRPAATITPLGYLDICPTGEVTLQANGGASFTYKWAVNGIKIPNATNQMYTATAPGSYTVKVTNASGCTRVSAPTVVYTSCRKSEVTIAMRDFISPNPSNGNFVLHIFSAQENEMANTTLIDLVGNIIMKKNLPLNTGETTSVFTLPQGTAKGIYFLRIETQEVTRVLRVVVE